MVLKAFTCFIFINYIVSGKYFLANMKERAIDESNSNPKGVDYMWGRPMGFGLGVQKKKCSFCEKHQGKHVVCYSMKRNGFYMKLGSFWVEMLLKNGKRFGIAYGHRDVTCFCGRSSDLNTIKFKNHSISFRSDLECEI